MRPLFQTLHAWHQFVPPSRAGRGRSVASVKYKRRAEVYVHRPEGTFDEQTYIIAPRMRGRIEEARPCTVVTCIDRAGNLRLWALKFPRENERDNDAWVSSRDAARQAQQGK